MTRPCLYKSLVAAGFWLAAMWAWWNFAMPAVDDVLRSVAP